MLEFLKGKKTYLVALLAAALGAWQAAGHEVPAWAYPILGALGLGALRAGVSSTAKTTAPLLLAALLLGACSSSPTCGPERISGRVCLPTPSVSKE